MISNLHSGVRGGLSVFDFSANFFRPHNFETPSQFIERSIVLPSGANETTPGPVSFDRRPFLKEIIDCLGDPAVETVWYVAPTRFGKTFLLKVGMAYGVAGDPGPALLIDSTMDKGRGFIKKEWHPLVEGNQCLRSRKPRNRHHYGDGMMLFPGAALTVFGANSDAQVSGETVVRVFGNEVGKWRPATEDEAAIVEQSMHRTESFENRRKHYYSTTPRREKSLEWKEVLKGDLRRWFVSFPGAKERHAMEWANVVWDQECKQEDGEWDLEGVMNTARYKCPETGELWDDEVRLEVVRQGEWRPTRKASPGYRSYQNIGLDGVLKAHSLGRLARDFLQARSDGFYVDRQDFWNARMGMVWVDNVADLSVDKCAALEKDYERGALPEGWKADVVIIGFDVQTWGLPWVCRAFQWTGESYKIDDGLAASWSDLQAVQDDYSHFGTSWVIGDINFEDRRAETLEAIYHRVHMNWIGAEGFEVAKTLTKVTKANVYMGDTKQKANIMVPKLDISLYAFKVEIEKRINGDIQNWWSYRLGADPTGEEIEDQKNYYREILNEKRRPRKKRRLGLPDHEFYAVGPNHKFDDEVYILALFRTLQQRQSARRRKIKTKRSIQVEK
ncbi:MAG: terminase gpA endonuclease subunit [Verrucomicrobiota bacterium]